MEKPNRHVLRRSFGAEMRALEVPEGHEADHKKHCFAVKLPCRWPSIRDALGDTFALTHSKAWKLDSRDYVVTGFH